VTFQIWRYRQGDLQLVAHANCGPITAVAFSPNDGRKLVAATINGGIVSWRIPPLMA